MRNGSHFLHEFAITIRVFSVMTMIVNVMRPDSLILPVVVIPITGWGEVVGGTVGGVGLFAVCRRSQDVQRDVHVGRTCI